MTSRYNQYHNFNKIFCLVLIPGLRILGRTSHWECLACHMIHVPRSQRRHKAPGDLRLRATGRRSEERDRKCSFHLPMCVDLSCAFWWSLLFYISFCLPSFPCLGIFFFSLSFQFLLLPSSGMTYFIPVVWDISEDRFIDKLNLSKSNAVQSFYSPEASAVVRPCPLSPPTGGSPHSGQSESLVNFVFNVSCLFKNHTESHAKTSVWPKKKKYLW